MKELELRGYQLLSTDGLRQGFAAKHRVQMLCAATGSGKSMCAVHLVQKAVAKGTRVAFGVDRVSLVDQISQTFADYGIEHGVIQANHWRFKPWERVQVISPATLARRDFSEMEPFGLLVWDEAHVSNAALLRMIAENPTMKVVGLSATPFAKGLGNTFTNIVNVTTTNKLIAEGWLAPLKVYAARAIDMRGAKKRSDGEWQPSEIEKRSLAIIGDILEGWIQKTTLHFGGKVKTIVFTATVAAGEEVCRQFQAAGYNFQQVSYLDGNDEARRDKIAEFRKIDSEIDGLVSCEALGRGLDVPDIKCMIGAKPYRKSLSGVVQQIGRVMRIAPGKEYALLLDHGSNWIRFEDDINEFFENGISKLEDGDLDSKVRAEPKDGKGKNECFVCGFQMMPKDETCPSCGKPRPKRKSDNMPVPGELIDVDTIKGKNGKALPEFLQNKARVQQELWGLALFKKKGDRVAAEKFALAQYKNIYNEWPKRAFRNIEPESCSYELGRRVVANLIRYKHSKRSDAPPADGDAAPQPESLL